MKIYLVRHAHAARALPGQQDANRCLSLDGRQTARAVGARLRKEGVVFDRVFTSPFVRAIQTAELTCSTLGYEGIIESSPALASGAAPQPAAALFAQGSEAVAAFSHEPTVSDLGAFLLGKPGFPPFRPGQVCLIEDGQPVWKLLPHTLEIEVLNA